MLKKLRQTPYIEEILGICGLALIVLLCALSFVIVRFMIKKAPSPAPSSGSVQNEIPLFRLEEAKKALER
ncbi:MAG: hypothetical protein A2939_03480 [Parcubacteria group bacterium RIFCSPLOWO2_01_FULL_48_18]|nr:MAG: hypothetical protein A2939_03480 [Parcubacteria group bacterium RIFCSPLOWO2_01_FULL_48_18]OHB23113.1 MAG: hypothetical protein A3J67_03105 [Parcubacteria group bacterium RIFCSPHIGHO2_02_FULL_48_10b]